MTGFASARLAAAELKFCSGLEETATARVPDPATETVRPAYLAHVVFQTDRIAEMSAWWRTVLAGAPTFSSDALEFITFDDEHHRVAILKRDAVRPKAKDAAVAGVHHIAFSYASLADLVSTYKRLEREGILPVRTIHHGITVSNYYLDPDDNRVELQVDAFPDKQTLNDWLAGRAFNDNPIGVLFDFEELVQRFEAGEAPERLLRALAAPAAETAGGG